MYALQHGVEPPRQKPVGFVKRRHESQAPGLAAIADRKLARRGRQVLRDGVGLPLMEDTLDRSCKRGSLDVFELPNKEKIYKISRTVVRPVL